MEQLDLKLGGEKKKPVFKRFADVCWSYAVTRTSSSTPTAPDWGHWLRPQSMGATPDAQHPSSAAAGVEESRAWQSPRGHLHFIASSELQHFVPQHPFSSAGTTFHLTETSQK